MKRKEIELHRHSNNKNCREYGESYVKYFYEPIDCSIRSNIIYADNTNQIILKDELVNNDMILSSLLNLGKLIYDNYLHNDIHKMDYLFNREVTKQLTANTIFEFIELETWVHPKIEEDVIKWLKINPYYGNISLYDNEIDTTSINFIDFISLAVISFVIHKLYNIAKRNTETDFSIHEPSLLAFFSDIIKNPSKESNNYRKKITKKLYLDVINHMKPQKVKECCITTLLALNIKYNPTNYYTKVFDDGSVAKIHYNLISIAFETLISKLCCKGREISSCSRCGNYYAGHGNSTLCLPCRIYKDNHKHVKSDRN